MQRSLPVLAVSGLWVVLGFGLLALWIHAWFSPASVRSWAQSIQTWLGATPPSVAWWQRGDTILHLVVGMVVTLWWGIALMPLRRRVPWWTGPMIAVAIIASDELLQSITSQRSFEFADGIAGLIGVSVAVLVLMGCHAVSVRSRRMHHLHRPVPNGPAEPPHVATSARNRSHGS